MPEPAEQPAAARPLRTWRPIFGWTLGILAVLGLAWFVGAVVVPMWPVWQVQLAVARMVRANGDDDVRDRQIARLGGEEATARKVTKYLQAGKRSTEQRYMALSLLEFSSTRTAIPGLILLAGDDVADIRGAAVELLSDEFGGDPQSFDVLAAALADEKADDFIRSWAAEGLRRTSDPRSVELLVAALRDENGVVRHAASSALSRLRDARTAELLGPLLKDQNEAVRKAAEELLKEFR